MMLILNWVKWENIKQISVRIFHLIATKNLVHVWTSAHYKISLILTDGHSQEYPFYLPVTVFNSMKYSEMIVINVQNSWHLPFFLKRGNLLHNQKVYLRFLVPRELYHNYWLLNKMRKKSNLESMKQIQICRLALDN